jgi:hypothetical protein
MHTIARTTFSTVKTEGAILPADLLQRIAEGRGLDGLRPEDYHLAPNERLNEAVNRSWNRLLGVWQSFDEQRSRLFEADSGVTLTRERWLLILFQELGYGRLPFQGKLTATTASGAGDGGSAEYPISHCWGHAPIHLVSFRQDLDRKDAAAKRSPHSLLQEYLNRAEDSLWGFVSNGLRLRVLRDNVSLTRAAFLEFDLEAMMTGELYADFALLWLVCHQSRVEGAPPSTCWLERWSQAAAEQGTRALDALRDGVQEAIAALGRGFLAHPANGGLRAAVKSGELAGDEYYRQLLRLVYRLIFLFVAEDRNLLLVRGASLDARAHYRDYYSLARLRTMAESRRGGPHPDLYRTLRLVCEKLRAGYPALSLPALGGFLFSERATPALDGADIANHDLLNAVRAPAFTEEGKTRRTVDYKNLGSEELGSVYESLLELHPQLNVDAGTFDLSVAAGSERKTTGSYYTPTSLINCLLDSALEPVVADRLAEARKSGGAEEQAILAIKVVDPAAGSGHFLIAAAHRLARHLARARTRDEEPAPAALRSALRDVVRHCIHGVDINPMAVELCKVALWMESLDPGKPLSFLDQNIQCGNSLIGATPALLARGIPEEAFTPITGDDKAYCSEFKKQNKREREGQAALFTHDLQPWNRLGNLAAAVAGMEAVDDGTLDGVRQEERLYEDLVRSSGYRYGRLLADAWCAAFVWKKTKEFAFPVTEQVFREIERNPYNLPKWMEEEIGRLRDQYQFFHWHLAFPDVFMLPKRGTAADSETNGWNGGFDVVLGNPPWEHTELKEIEWFAERRPDIAAAATGAQRKLMIDALEKVDPALYIAFIDARRSHDAVSHFVGNGGSYPLCGRGRINTFAVFAELARALDGTSGRVGITVPSGIATDDTTKFFFQDLTDEHALVSLYDFENRRGIFPGVHRSYKFCLLTLTGPARPATRGADFVFFALSVDDLRVEDHRVNLDAQDIALFNPNTRTCPIIRNRRDADLNKAIYRRIPVLINRARGHNPWGASFRQGLFNLTSASGLFRSRQQLETDGWHLVSNEFHRGNEVYLPLYEAKMLHHFDHRWVTYEWDQARDVTVAEKIDPNYLAKLRLKPTSGEAAIESGR